MALNEKPTRTIIIQEQKHIQEKIIDITDGMNTTEFLLIILVLTSFFSSVLPFLMTGRKIYNSVIYLNKNDLRLQLELQKCLDQLLAITYADRVIIGLFHNGTTDNLGFHQKKMSVYAESCTDQTKSIRRHLQAIPIENILEEILAADTKQYQTVTRGTTDNQCDLHLDSLGISRKDFRTFRRVKKEIYGIINCHYMQEPEEHFLNDPHRTKQVALITQKIEQILEKIKAPNTPKWLRFIGSLVRQYTEG